MAPVACLVAGVGVTGQLAPAAEVTAGASAPIFGITLPTGYRDWRLIAVAHEAGKLDDLRAPSWATTW